MKTAKTTYSMKELTRRSTTQLIAIYNRVFNTNVWDERFNPYEARQEMILALYAETQAAEALALYPKTDTVEKYRAIQIRFTEDGLFMVWGKHHSGSARTGRKVTREQIIIMRAMRDDGETYRSIETALGLANSTIYRVLKQFENKPLPPPSINDHALDLKAHPVASKTRSRENVFIHRSNNAFWASFGL